MNRHLITTASLFAIAATLACSVKIGYRTHRNPITSTALRCRAMTQPPNISHQPQQPNHPATNNHDFKPCSGYNAINPDGKPQTGYGPLASRLMTALSTDGINFTRTNKIISDQSDVPDIITMPDGEVRIYYITMCPEEVRNKIVVAVSKDNGTTWVYKKIKLNGVEKVLQPSQVDPTVEFTPDNKMRLYFTSGPGNIGAGKPNTALVFGDPTDGYNLRWMTALHGR